MRRVLDTNPKINDKDYCRKVYNFSFGQAKLELPLKEVFDHVYEHGWMSDNDYNDIYRDLFQKKLYEILDNNVETLNLIPCHGQPSWQDWIDKDKREEFDSSEDTIDYFGRLFSVAIGCLQ